MNINILKKNSVVEGGLTVRSLLLRNNVTYLKNKIFKNRSSTPINKDKHFITRTAYLSVELNARNLLYLILLVQQKQLPKEYHYIFFCLIHNLVKECFGMQDR